MLIATDYGPLRLDDEDAHLVADGCFKVRLNPNGRVRDVVIKGRSLHSELMKPPPGLDVDHINRDPLDNRRCNLRLATRSQNLYNRRGWSKKGHGFKGIVWMPPRPGKGRGKWEARVMIDGKKRAVGRSDDPAAAARLYDKAAREHYGEFALLNFPDWEEN